MPVTTGEEALIQHANPTAEAPTHKPSLAAFPYCVSRVQGSETFIANTRAREDPKACAAGHLSVPPAEKTELGNG